MATPRHALALRRGLASAAEARAAVFRSHGAPASVLKVEKQSIPASIGSNQVLVRMLAAPLNPADFNVVEGVYGISASLPAVGGNEGVAVVEKVGAGVKDFKAGDWVIPAKPLLGTWRTHAVVGELDVAKIASDIPKEYAATLSVNPSTALRLIEDFAKLKAGDVIVQNGANSVVGQCVIQLAKARGVKTINIIRDRADYAETAETLKSMGADVVVSEDYAKRQAMADIIADFPAAKLGLNCVGGPSATEVVRLLGKGGVMVTYGGMSRKPVTIPTSALIFKDITVRGFWLSRWADSVSPGVRLAAINQLADMVRSKKLQYMMERKSFDEFDVAVLRALQPRKDRKIVLDF
eukprot:tig00021612_g22880.t1